MQDINWPYFAAIIDGEGHLGDPSNGLIISTTNQELGVWLRRKVGGKLRRIRQRKFRDIWRWWINAKELKKLMPLFEDYLVIKRKNIDLWKEYLDTPKVYNNQFRSLYNKRFEILRKIKNEIRSNYPLNSGELRKDNPELSSLKPETNSYLAGIIDGEGAIIMRHRQGRWGTVYLPQIMVCNTNPKLMIWLKNNFGGYISVVKGNDKWKDRYYWKIDVKLSRILMKEIEKFAIIKKPHLKQLKKFFNLKKEFKERGCVLTKHSEKRANKIAKTISILNQKKSLLVRGESATTIKEDAKII